MGLDVIELDRSQLEQLPAQGFDLASMEFDSPDPYLPPIGTWLVVKDGPRFAASAAITARESDRCEITHFVVHPAYHGQGLGGRLMRQLLERARDLDYSTIQAEMTPWCPDWRAFYKRHGFVFQDPTMADTQTGTAIVERSLT